MYKITGNEKATAYFQLFAFEYHISNNPMQDTKTLRICQISGIRAFFSYQSIPLQALQPPFFQFHPLTKRPSDEGHTPLIADLFYISSESVQKPREPKLTVLQKYLQHSRFLIRVLNSHTNPSANISTLTVEPSLHSLPIIHKLFLCPEIPLRIKDG